MTFNGDEDGAAALRLALVFGQNGFGDLALVEPSDPSSNTGAVGSALAQMSSETGGGGGGGPSSDEVSRVLTHLQICQEGGPVVVTEDDVKINAASLVEQLVHVCMHMHVMYALTGELGRVEATLDSSEIPPLRQTRNV